MISLNNLQKIAGQDSVIENELMSRHTTLRIGGPARFFIKVDTSDILKELLEYLIKEKEEYFLLGNGSNLLVKDQGYDGVIIKLGRDFESIKMDSENIIKAGAAAMLSSVSHFACDNSLKGLEFASGIPGTLGGALFMNAGAYDGEMKQVVGKVFALVRNKDTFSYEEFSCDAMHFSYRHSIAKEREMIILGCTLVLEPGDGSLIKDIMNDLNNRRREKQPLEYPSAGSTFKRPEGFFAGKLISDAELKGYSVGDAAVSEKHAGFCINKGNATAQDFITLMDDVAQKVYEQFGVELEPEVIIIGS